MQRIKFLDYVKHFVPAFKSKPLKFIVNNDLLNYDSRINEQSLSLFESNILKLSYVQKYSYELFDELPGDTTPKDVSKSILNFLYGLYSSSPDSPENPMTRFLMNYGNSNIGLLHMIYNEKFKKLESQVSSPGKIYLEKIFYMNQLFNYIKPEEEKYVIANKSLINPNISTNFCFYAYKLALAEALKADPDSLKNLKLKYILSKEIINQLQVKEFEKVKKKTNYDRDLDISESSNTHKSICTSLERIKISFEMEKQLHFYRCDIYLPLYKTVLEYLGPIHFYPEQSQLRQFDKLRNEYLTDLLEVNLELVPWFIIALQDTDYHVDGFLRNLISKKIKGFNLNKEHFN